MYVSRRAAHHHGDYQFHLMLLNIVATSIAAALATNPLDYVVIFLSGGLLYFSMEFRLARKGVRKIEVDVYGKRLTRFQACLMRGFTEGSCCCVAGFFFADRVLSGQPAIAWAGLLAYSLVYGTYSSLMDYRDMMSLPPEKRGVIGRRNMAAPRLVMGVPSVTAIALTGLYHLNEPLRTHGFYYLFGAFTMVAIFFIVNGLPQVRLIELKDENTGEFKAAHPAFQTLAFTYDALFEMGFLFVLFYLIPLWLGLYSFAGVVH
jgi:hypothetical protein